MPLITRPPYPLLKEAGYGMVPDALLEHPVLFQSPSAWASMVKLYGLFDGHKYENDQALAEKLGYELKTLQKHFPIWRASGFVRKTKSGIHLWPFEDGSELPEIETAEETIADSVAAMPKREKGDLSPKERHALIKEAWNKHKPDNFLSADGSLKPTYYIAIETHTKRLKHDRDDYDGFIGAVMRGISADTTGFWKSSTPFFRGVFGEGADPGDDKFRQVERFYKIGMQHAPRVKLEDKGDEWYLAKALELWPNAPYKRVERRVLKTADQALLASEGPKMVNDIKTGLASADDHNVIVKKQKLVDLGLNAKADPEWYNEEVLGLAFVQGTEFPLYWTSIDKLPRN